MKNYVKDSFGQTGGKIVLVVFFILLIALSVAGAIYVFNGNQLVGESQSITHTENNGGSSDTYIFNLKESTLNMKTGETKQLTYNANDNKAKDAIEWTSSNEKTVFVDAQGNCFALKKGKATITATAGYYSSSCTVTVKGEAKKESFGYSTAYTANKEIVEKNKNSSSGQNLYSIDVNRNRNYVIVYTYDENGEYTVPVRSMICSCGDGDATPTGTFSIYVKMRWQPLFGNVFGQYVTGFNGDILFHSVPYEEMENPSSVEIKDYNGLGTSISMGCVRLAVADSKWIYDNCPEGTIVNVVDEDKDSPLGNPPSMHLNTDKTTGWDPTDNNKKNPYNKKSPTFENAEDTEIAKGDKFDILSGVKAKDTTGNDITNRIKAEGKVDSDKSGKYLVKYTVKDDINRSATHYRIITVKE